MTYIIFIVYAVFLHLSRRMPDFILKMLGTINST